MNTNKVTRFEIIDHTICERCQGSGRIRLEECTKCKGIGCPGRTVIVNDDRHQIDVEMQDDDRTLKVFIHEKYED